MATTYTKIATATAASGGSATLGFSAIPQTYRDLKIILSTRCSQAATLVDNRMRMGNGSANSSAIYNYIEVIGTGTGSPFWGSGTLANQHNTIGSASTATANAFSNVEIRIFNYASATLLKHSLVDAVVDQNSASTGVQIRMQSWYQNSAAAIDTIEFSLSSGTYLQYSTATLYGIKSS
jgi:hypothetical protein